MWLLSRGRMDEAKRTFRKLRGDATEEKCMAEFQEMVDYASEMSPKSQQTGLNKLTFLWYWRVFN